MAALSNEISMGASAKEEEVVSAAPAIDLKQGLPTGVMYKAIVLTDLPNMIAPPTNSSAQANIPTDASVSDDEPIDYPLDLFVKDEPPRKIIRTANPIKGKVQSAAAKRLATKEFLRRKVNLLTERLTKRENKIRQLRKELKVLDAMQQTV